MKKMILALAIVAGSIAINEVDAQVHVSLNIGIPVPVRVMAPAPVVVAPAPVVAVPSPDYYYYPDINCYYDAAQAMYIYPENNVWVTSAVVPAFYGGYDFRRGRRVAMNAVQFRNRGIRFAQGRPAMYNRQAPRMVAYQRQDYNQNRSGRGEVSRGRGNDRRGW